MTAQTVEIVPEQIKKTLKFEESDVLHINLKYPRINISPSVIYEKSEKKINDFYCRTVKNFAEYCEKILYKNAAFEFLTDKAAGTAAGFKPFGAVITYGIAHNRQDLLSIYFDINIYSGKGRGNSVRKAQIWKLSGGELLSPAGFIKETRRRVF